MDTEKRWYYWSLTYAGQNFCPVAGGYCAMGLPTEQPDAGMQVHTDCICGCGQCKWYWNANTQQWEGADTCRIRSGCSPVTPTAPGAFHGHYMITNCE